MDRLRAFLWNIWIPDYEGGGPWHLRWRASLMYWVRRVWFHYGNHQRCICPGCPEMVHMASASGLCGMCAAEDCQHTCEMVVGFKDASGEPGDEITCDDVGTTRINGVLACENHRRGMAAAERAKETGR